jgi:hypothetical protein
MAPKKGAKNGTNAKPPVTTTTDLPPSPTKRSAKFVEEYEKEVAAYKLAEACGYDDQWRFGDMKDSDLEIHADLTGLTEKVMRYITSREDEKKQKRKKKQPAAEGDNEIWECKSEPDTNYKKGTDADPKGVRIRVVRHGFYTAYSIDPRVIEPYHLDRSVLIPAKGEQPLDRETLDWCSNHARQVFEGDSKCTEVHLPVQYPRKHTHNWHCYFKREDVDQHCSYVKPDAVQNYIVPWLRKMEKIKPRLNKDNRVSNIKVKDGSKDLPSIEIPASMEDRIHLYNCMLHLGILKHFQEPLIAKLCDDIYCNKLKDCHLELLDITIGRFHCQTVAVLDPVLSCFTGSFNLRPKKERLVIQPSPRAPLKYGLYKEPRVEGAAPGPHYTKIIAPGLPVLGHCLRHWSGVREDGKRRDTGYPLDYYDSPELEGKTPERPDPLRCVKHLKNRAGRKRKACDCEECGGEQGPANKVSKQ